MKILVEPFIVKRFNELPSIIKKKMLFKNVRNKKKIKNKNKKEEQNVFRKKSGKIPNAWVKKDDMKKTKTCCVSIPSACLLEKQK